METITVRVADLLKKAKLLKANDEKIVEITLLAQDGNPEDGDDFYEASINFQTNHGDWGEDYDSIYSVITHNHFDYEANNGEPEIQTVSVFVKDLLEISKKMKSNKIDCAEFTYSSKLKSALTVTPEFEISLYLSGYNSTTPNNKISYGPIALLDS